MADKIFLNGTFAYREDTLENWQNYNPILEKGEPSIVRDGADGEWLKIGDGVTAWNDLPWKKGPKGDIGPIGPVGPQGIQGPEGPKGEKGDGAEIEVDQVFNPKSENPQSGIAVAEALSTVHPTEKEWQVIEDITLTEAIMQIDIPVSKLQGIKELHISTYIIPTDTTITSQDVLFGISGKTYWTGKANPKAKGHILGVMDISISPRKTTIFDGTISAYDYTLSGTSYKGLGYFRNADMNDESFIDLSSGSNIWMRTTSTNPMAAGTRFKVWGR